jgi:hypothetical protein
MKIGQKIYVVDDDIIGVVYSVDPITNVPTKVKVGDKIIDIVGKTIKLLTWAIQILQFIKSFIK